MYQRVQRWLWATLFKASTKEVQKESKLSLDLKNKTAQLQQSGANNIKRKWGIFRLLLGEVKRTK